MREHDLAAPARFSPSAYAARLNQVVEAEQFAAAGAGEAAGDLTKLAEDIRTFLATPRGATEEERRQYNERLNRAVLGFPEERAELLAVINDRLMRRRIHHLTGGWHPYESLAEALFAEVIGLNVLELVLQGKEGLEEIQVVGTQVFEVRGGVAIASPYAFASVREVERIQQNLVLFNNDRINPRKRWAEVMLSDGSRVTMTGFGFTSEPTLTMRFYTVRHFALSQLSGPELGTMSAEVAELLRLVLRARFNLVIIGPTNSGKTHLMKALIAELPEAERIVTIENRLEMMLRRDFPAKNIIEYEADDEDALHQSAQAFKLALRQSPQRIVRAEIRDDDANIYVRACTRGHEGSMTTVHANALEDVPEAITDMCMLDGRGMNPERLMKRITEYVTQIGIELRTVSGKRRLVRLGEYVWQGGEAHIREWVRFDPQRGRWLLPERPSSAAELRLRRARGIETEVEH
ncbi:Flp pilus assembly complex ATPase component TadA [Paenibacillus sp. IB182496]|uniref:Flp pilus assembly complex ATPase component TadA n=2 Tax=Paenibacillus sabuli TaxID=2772509 RepID=A0A927GTF9_9BACL|nr:Flp pilus assembly complex ATPase component TadA [Paenibacillus sabuli]